MNILKFIVWAKLCLCASFQMVLSAAALLTDTQDLQIVKIESLAQIPASQEASALYFFDIDDTLFDSSFMLGSKAWRKYITAATKDDLAENWHDVFSLFVARKYPLRTVERITSQFVKNLQMKGNAVFGLTARERKRWYDTPMDDIDLLTIGQLSSVGIDFDIETGSQLYPHLTNAPEYFKGVFFADIEPKGNYLLKLFKCAALLPEKVIFIDDKQSQVESVAQALDQLGISYECYWYTATDEKAKLFDPLIANIQLYHLWTSGGDLVLSDEEAASIVKRYPYREAEYYLQALLGEAKAAIN